MMPNELHLRMLEPDDEPANRVGNHTPKSHTKERCVMTAAEFGPGQVLWSICWFIRDVVNSTPTAE